MKAIGINLSDLVREAMGEKDDSQEKKSRPLDEAQVMELRDAFERYTAPCPFKPGDLVTPRPNSNYKDVGVPHIVLEVFDNPIRVFNFGDDLSDISSSVYGSKLDMRVAVLIDGAMVPFCQESWKHERWTPKAPDEAI